MQGLRTVIYKVDDLERAKHWYSDAFGVIPYFDQPFYVGFNIGGFELGLDPDLTNVVSGNSQIAYWGVENASEAFDRLIEKGASPDSVPQNVGGSIVVATVVDPFGNTIGIIENPDFKIDGVY
jgi:lactoylglutathione lyase